VDIDLVFGSAGTCGKVIDIGEKKELNRKLYRIYQLTPPVVCVYIYNEHVQYMHLFEGSGSILFFSLFSLDRSYLDSIPRSIFPRNNNVFGVIASCLCNRRSVIDCIVFFWGGLPFLSLRAMYYYYYYYLGTRFDNSLGSWLAVSWIIWLASLTA